MPVRPTRLKATPAAKVAAAVPMSCNRGLPRHRSTSRRRTPVAPTPPSHHAAAPGGVRRRLYAPPGRTSFGRRDGWPRRRRVAAWTSHWWVRWPSSR
jgi:hypothetical protein